MPARNIALVLLGLLVIAAIRTQSLAFAAMVLIGAVVGPVVGLTSDEPYFTAIFKIGLVCGLIVAAAMMWLGWRRRERLWGQGLVVGGAVGWAICGLLGFGPQ